jgi:ABC-type transport system involved in multi-copper enzyme maturation permease subunit
MTTTAAARVSPVAGARLSIGGILRSEWTKLRSLRSTVWSLIVALLLVIGLSAIFCAATASHWKDMGPAERASFDSTSTSTAGGFLAQLAIGVLGVLLISGEYSTGMIRATMTAVPRRQPALWAKAVVFAVVTFVTMEIAGFIAFTIGQSLLKKTGQQAHLGDPGVMRAVMGFGLYLTVVGLLGMGLGALLRHTAGAISTLMGLLLVLPILANLLPSNWRDDIEKYLPGQAGQQILMVPRPGFSDPSQLSPWVGFGVFVLWAAVVLGVAAVLLQRRDV